MTYAIVAMIQGRGRLEERYLGMAKDNSEVDKILHENLTGPAPAQHWTVYRKIGYLPEKWTTVWPQDLDRLEEKLADDNFR